MKKTRWVAFISLVGLLAVGSVSGAIALPGDWLPPDGGYDGVYDAADGNLPADSTPAFTSTYATYGGGAGEAMIADGTILSMTNSVTTGPYYYLGTGVGQGTATGDMTVDVRMKLSDVGTTNNYQFSLLIYRPANAAQVAAGTNTVGYLYRLGSDSASYAKLGTDWVDLRILIDADTQTPTVYLNGSSAPVALAGANTYRFLEKTTAYNYIRFGDGGSSGGIGSVELEYIAWSNDEMASVAPEPIPIVLPGTWQLPSGGYDGVYDATNGNLPEASTPAFTGTYDSYGGGAGEAMIAGGTILGMTNSATTGPYYNMSSGAGQGTATDDMTYDIRMKLSDVGTENNYQFALSIYRPANASQVSNGINRVQYFWRLASDSASYGRLGTNWLDMRILIDGETQTPTVYFDGSSTPTTLSGANTYKFYTSAASGNYIRFGDMGSSGGIGRVELKHFAWSNHELASVVPLDPYDAWMAPYTEILSEAEQEKTADPDGDSMENLLEYALGGNPTINDAGSILPSCHIEGDGMMYQYNRRTNHVVLGLSYYLELRDDLVFGSWTNDPGLYTVTGTSTDGSAAGFEAVSNRISTTMKDEQFVRLGIEEEQQ